MKKKGALFLVGALVLGLLSPGVATYAKEDMTAEQAKKVAEEKAPTKSEFVSVKDDGREYDVTFLTIDKKEQYIYTISKAAKKVVSYETERVDAVGSKKVVLTEKQAEALVKAEQEKAEIDETKLESEDGYKLYEVSFHNSDCYGEYQINPATGEIVERDIEIGREATAQDAKNLIGKRKAKKLAAAVYPKGEVEEVDLEWENNSYFYQVEMTVNKKEYEVELNAYTGEVLWTGLQDGKGIVLRNEEKKKAENKLIGKEVAKQIALAKVPNATVTKCKLEKDDGQYYYEVELEKGNFEYEFEIDAKTGDILDSDMDELDD